MPRSTPRLLPTLSLIVALLDLSYPCAQGHATKQGPARPASASASASARARVALFPSPPSPYSSDLDPDLPSASASGYVANGGGGQLFFTYYEKKNSTISKDDPIFLWLEGGPGCASSFGNFYINGPSRALASRDERGQRKATGKLKNNPHAWNALGGLLYIDQPVGTGFSVPGLGGKIPRTELEVAADLYFGLCELFGAGGPLESEAARPLFVTGESYAGKFVPSIAHYILQVEAETGGGSRMRKRRRAGATTAVPVLRVRRELRREKEKDATSSGGATLSLLRPPPFHLAGIAVVRVIFSLCWSISGRERAKKNDRNEREKKNSLPSLKKKT